jgi:2-iminoacetate synthase
MRPLPDWLTDNRETASLAAMLAPDSSSSLETLAAESRAITLRRFGRTMSLYAPLYLSNYCSSGCAYCGFASDRKTPRHRLEPDEIRRELAAMKKLGISVQPQPALTIFGAALQSLRRRCSGSRLRLFP